MPSRPRKDCRRQGRRAGVGKPKVGEMYSANPLLTFFTDSAWEAHLLHSPAETYVDLVRTCGNTACLANYPSGSLAHGLPIYDCYGPLNLFPPSLPGVGSKKLAKKNQLNEQMNIRARIKYHLIRAHVCLLRNLKSVSQAHTLTPLFPPHCHLTSCT